MYSTLNSSNAPLPKNGIFIGRYEDMASYESITISINADTNCQIVSYLSPNKLTTIQQQFLINPNEEITFVINPIAYKYFYLTCLNLDNTAQTKLNLQTAYKTVNTPVTSTPFGTIPFVNQSGSTDVFSGATGVNGYSLPVFINLLSKNITIFGNVDDSTTLTVAFSNDNITYYDSQYQVNLSGATDFGFNLPSTCAIKYLKIKSSDNVTCNCFVNYC
jgi:hypothetical protein